jgi:polyhydroxybutyrate depolymerase
MPITRLTPRRRLTARIVVLVGMLVGAVAIAIACVPIWPAEVAVTATAVTATSIELSWPAAAVDTDTVVASYEVTVDGVVAATTPGTTRTASLTDLAPDTAYTVTVRALDAKSQWSDPTPAATTAIVEHRTLVHDGLTRSYRLDIPAGYNGDAGAPLVVALHGGGGTPDGFASYTRLPAAAASHGFIVAYPEGTAGAAGLRAWNAGGCCGTAQSSQVDDVGFIAALRTQVTARLRVNSTTLTGHSNGAILAYRFACERAAEVDGIAIYAGTLFVNPCAPSQPVSLLHIHGLADTNLPFAGGKGTGLSGVTFPPVLDGIETIRTADGCAGSPGTTTVDGVATTTWACPAGTSVQLVTIDDATHEWAGGVDTPLAGTPSTKLDATAVIAAFVAAR